MLKILLKIAISSILHALALIIVGYGISVFFTEHPKSLDFILFLIGALPIVFFTSGIFTKSTSGAVHSPDRFYELIRIRATFQSKKNSQEYERNRTGKAYYLSLVLSGIIVWIVSYYV